MGVLLSLAIVLFVLILLFVIFTAPLWIPVLIIWLLVRKSRKKEHEPTQSSKPRETGERPQQSTDNYNKSEN